MKQLFIEIWHLCKNLKLTDKPKLESKLLEVLSYRMYLPASCLQCHHVKKYTIYISIVKEHVLYISLMDFKFINQAYFSGCSSQKIYLATLSDLRPLVYWRCHHSQTPIKKC